MTEVPNTKIVWAIAFSSQPNMKSSPDSSILNIPSAPLSEPTPICPKDEQLNALADLFAALGKGVERWERELSPVTERDWSAWDS